jgi:tRNA pseudouridine38-40 synthase
MPRYFIEVAYRGTAYSGFQVQANAVTIQSEVERVLQILLRERVSLTGSSRTDAGVHALQNFFHLDLLQPIDSRVRDLHELTYKLNALLPQDIVVKRVVVVGSDRHCRFDAVSRDYLYRIYRFKDPFLEGRGYYFPYPVNRERMQQAAGLVRGVTDFTAFAKRNTQVRNFECTVFESRWIFRDNGMIYRVSANRFLRGMVRALTATMLRVGREKMDLGDFRAVLEGRDNQDACFAAPAAGLFLKQVNFPPGYFG